MRRTILLHLILIIGTGLPVFPIWAANHLVVLQYHHFSTKTPPSTSIKPQEFDLHLEYLLENGFAVWPLKKSLSYLRQGRELPDNCVAITVDDAYISIYEEAYPRLKQKGWPFTVFVATEPIEKGSKAFLTWDQMREMKEHGVDFEMHSHTHAYLVRIKKELSTDQWLATVRQEILTSRERLEEELGYRSGIFAYPYGEYDEALKNLVLEMGLIGVGQHSGAIWKGSDWGALPRFPMSGPYAALKEFRVKVRTLPLPVTRETPADPVLQSGNMSPSLVLELGEGPFAPEQINCYASGQGRVKTFWQGKTRKLQVFPNRSLPKGRSRYNCTVRHKKLNRYFWFSRQWLRLD